MSDISPSGVHDTPEDRVTIRPQGLQGLLALVPYLLGFHPEDSLVAVLLDQGRVCLTLRLDLRALREDPDEVARIIATQQRRLDASHLLLVAYTNDVVGNDGDGGVMTVLTDLALTLEFEALTRGDQAPVLDAVQVAGGRYRSLGCAESGCCAGAGHDYQAVLNDPAAAQAVVHGIQARGHRDDLRALIAPGSERGDDAYQRVVAETASTAQGLSGRAVAYAMDALLQQIADADRVPAPAVLAELTGLVCHPAARDVASLRIDHASAPLWIEVWAAAARATDGPAAVGPLALTGLAAWARGNGALVNVCVEQAEQRGPDHGLVRILSDVVERGLHPDTWTRMREHSLAEFGPLGPSARTP
ncbi:DUF4192 domain-containing protein [Granulicoccus sp. GXG6511]|uniref:DUF4192 domain-containing protein n=1 Tax=Granulicoccus sp. GXG6511 TaxID=3381351 RepID=UPI003D7DD761